MERRRRQAGRRAGGGGGFGSPSTGDALLPSRERGEDVDSSRFAGTRLRLLAPSSLPPRAGPPVRPGREGVAAALPPRPVLSGEACSGLPRRGRRGSPQRGRGARPVPARRPNVAAPEEEAEAAADRSLWGARGRVGRGGSGQANSSLIWRGGSCAFRTASREACCAAGGGRKGEPERLGKWPGRRRGGCPVQGKASLGGCWPKGRGVGRGCPPVAPLLPAQPPGSVQGKGGCWPSPQSSAHLGVGPSASLLLSKHVRSGRKSSKWRVCLCGTGLEAFLEGSFRARGGRRDLSDLRRARGASCLFWAPLPCPWPFSLSCLPSHPALCM